MSKVKPDEPSEKHLEMRPKLTDMHRQKKNLSLPLTGSVHFARSGTCFDCTVTGHFSPPVKDKINSSSLSVNG